jgi:hypothetical protein
MCKENEFDLTMPFDQQCSKTPSDCQRRCARNFLADMYTMMVVELYLFSADAECQSCPAFPIMFRRNNCLILFQEQIFTRHTAFFPPHTYRQS